MTVLLQKMFPCFMHLPFKCGRIGHNVNPVTATGCISQLELVTIQWKAVIRVLVMMKYQN